jgi:hypothetical protein
VRGNGPWTAHPDQGHDPKLRALTPDQYLPCALNTYCVVLTRGTHTTRTHTTDPDTHHMLQSLSHPARRSPTTAASKSSRAANAR